MQNLMSVAQIQSKNLQKINLVVLSSASLNNNLPAKTSLSTSGISKSRDVQEDLSISPEVLGDVSTSSEPSRHVSGYEDHDYVYVSQIPEHLGRRVE